MLLHYFKIAWRYLVKQRTLTIINVLGLTVGISVSLLIFLYVKYDLGYDTYNKYADRIYRIGLHGKMGNTEFTQTYTTPMLASSILNSCPNVVAAVRMNSQESFLKYDDGKGNVIIHKEDRIVSADSSLFDVFTFKILAGDPREALKEPGTITLTESAVHRYFGNVKNYASVLGKQLQVNVRGKYFPNTVRGVIRDIPEQSHFHFDFLISNEIFPFAHQDNWFNNGYKTYIRLDRENDIKKVAEKLPGIYMKHMGGKEQVEAWLAQGNQWYSFIQSLRDIHLKSHVTGEWEANFDIKYDWILSVISVFIILIACVNFINLSTSKAVIRSREIGVKKTLGSRRYQLVLQLLTESFIVCFLAVNFSLVSARLILPFFNDFTGRHLDLDFIWSFQGIIILTGFVMILALLSGLYPAFYITSVKPVRALQGRNRSSGRERFFRNGLVVFQFAISLFIIISTFLVNRQLDFIRNENLGFNKNNIVVLSNVNYIGNNLNILKNELLNIPSVRSASASYSVPGKGHGNVQFRPEGYDENILFDLIFSDDDYLKTFDMKLKEGRYFNSRRSSDSTAIVINESARKNLGWDHPLGKTIRVFGKSGDPYTVIGVVDDYHYISMHDRIRPFVILPSYCKKSFGNNYLSLKIDGRDIPGTLKKIGATWKDFSELPFEYFFMDESYDRLYRNEAYTRSIFRTFSFISIFIAVLGLFGLVLYNIEQRTKEIGIRKTFGATAVQIVMLLSFNFSKWILAGFFLAVPVSWWLMNVWLRSFAYKTPIPVWVFPAALVLVVLIAWLTTGFQSLRAALKSPVEALRYE